MHKIKSPDLTGWVINEGGRVVVDWMRHKKDGWRFRIYVLGVSLYIRNKDWCYA